LIVTGIVATRLNVPPLLSITTDVCLVLVVLNRPRRTAPGQNPIVPADQLRQDWMQITGQDLADELGQYLRRRIVSEFGPGLRDRTPHAAPHHVPPPHIPMIRSEYVPASGRRSPRPLRGGPGYAGVRYRAPDYQDEYPGGPGYDEATGPPQVWDDGTRAPAVPAPRPAPSRRRAAPPSHSAAPQHSTPGAPEQGDPAPVEPDAAAVPEQAPASDRAAPAANAGASLGDRAKAELRNAFAQGQLQLQYQPIYDTSLKVASCEALVRWQHPDWGVLMPGQFLPLARDLGMINQLTSVVIRRALKELAGWLPAQPQMELSLNVEISDLEDSRFSELLWLLLANTRVSPGRVILEVPVGQLRSRAVQSGVQDPAAGLVIGPALRLSVDGWLADEPLADSLYGMVGEVKIDLRRSSASHDVIAREVRGGHERQLRMVAVGLEGPDDIAAARQMGFDRLQGFGLSKPVGAGQLTEVFAREIEMPAAADAVS
jgi:EAL domain-containing protein (putative c-di-GMP-specific phosphodiesterase class I)